MYFSPQRQEFGHGVASPRSSNDPVYSDSCLLIEQKKYFASVKGQAIRLTKTEFRILSCLAGNMNGVTKLEELWNVAWDPSKALHRKSIQVMMSRVRAKVAPSGLQIHSLVDIGYMLSHGSCCNSSDTIGVLAED